jgi:hypothetical protein
MLKFKTDSWHLFGISSDWNSTPFNPLLGADEIIRLGFSHCWIQFRSWSIHIYCGGLSLKLVIVSCIKWPLSAMTSWLSLLVTPGNVIKKFKDAQFCTIVRPKFEQIITTYQHPLLGGWESQWRVMAASHCCSWWRWWSCTLSETQKVMAKLILVIFVLFGQIWRNILSSGYCNVIWSFLSPFSIDIAFLLNYVSLLMPLTCSFFILIVMGAITTRQADVLSWETFDKGLLVLCLHSIKSIAWTFMFELFLYKMCLRL